MTQTPLQKATAIVIDSYRAALKTLTAAEAEALRDTLAARLAADYLAALGAFDDEAARWLREAA
jgi:hypothetical protein